MTSYLSSADIKSIARNVVALLSEDIERIVVDAMAVNDNKMMYKHKIADFLGTTPKAVIKKFERKQLPGKKDVLGHWYCMSQELNDYLQGTGENTEN